jgi:predicted metal-dependent HD superfamily phosphohydrolase
MKTREEIYKEIEEEYGDDDNIHRYSFQHIRAMLDVLIDIRDLLQKKEV